jgi:hypothetical protein
MHPYQRFELLTKIFNNLTTRSNCFAVWCTVGYFEVVDDTTRPVTIGPEFGLAQGQNVRQRFFAVVDRTNLTLGYGQTAALSGIVAANGPPQTLTVEAVQGTIGGPTVSTTVPWNIQAGMNVVIDLGLPTEETLVVQQVIIPPPVPPANPQIVVSGSLPMGAFKFDHQPGATITVANPAVQTGPPVVFLNSTSAVTTPGPGTWMDVASLSGVYDGIPWSIQGNVAAVPVPQGSVLVVDVGANQEIVAVLSTGTDPTTKQLGFTANFQKPHAPGCVISNTLIGNPGPQPGFTYKDPRYAAVVRYFAILD